MPCGGLVADGDDADFFPGEGFDLISLEVFSDDDGFAGAEVGIASFEA